MANEFVVCINNSDYQASLEIRKIYQVVPDKKAGKLKQLRIIDESGEDYLYPASRFMEIKLSKPVRDALSNAA